MSDQDSERRVSQLLEELGSADPPPDFSRNVVWGIRHNHITIHRTRTLSNKIATTTKAMWGLAAAASILLGVFIVRGFPSADQGTEGTIGAAQRYQAPQIEAKDVVIGDTSPQAVMQAETWDRIVKDETLRTLLLNDSVRAQLQEAALRTALTDGAIVRALQDPNLSRQLNSAELVRSLHDANLVKKIADPNLRAALQNQAFLDALRNNDFRAQLADPRIAAALAGAAFQNALRDRGFAAAMGHERFSQALAARGGCDDWGCGMNSPVVDGARID
jgi:hypothetical protein